MLRKHIWLPIVTGVAVLTAVLVVVGLNAGGATSAPQVQQRIVQQHSDMYQDPSLVSLTPDQTLDRSLSLPGIRGVLRGRIGLTPTVYYLSAQASANGGTIVTDFPLLVEGFYGHGTSPYAHGLTITLRIPGGTLNGTTLQVEGGPSYFLERTRSSSYETRAPLVEATPPTFWWHQAPPTFLRCPPDRYMGKVTSGNWLNPSPGLSPTSLTARDEL